MEKIENDTASETKRKQSTLERVFEWGLWQTRFTVLLAVVFSLLSSLVLFILASVDVVEVCFLVIDHYFHELNTPLFLETVIGKVIGSVDMYLIGVVLLILGFGLYELFISRVDVSETREQSSALRVHSLNELKNKITKVVIMVMVVNFFQRALVMEFRNAQEMFFLALSICALSVGLYFLHRNDEKENT